MYQVNTLTWKLSCIQATSNFRDWKEEVEENVKGYSSLSEEVTDSLLDKEIEKGEIAKCLRNLKIARLVVVTE